MISGEMLNQMYQSTLGAPNHTHSYTIAPCQKTACTGYKYVDQCAKQEGEKPMCYNSKPAFPSTASSVQIVAAEQPSIEMTQRDFFSERIKQEVRRIEHDLLRPQFFMDAEKEPLNAVEMIKKITDGDYSLNDKEVQNIKDNPDCYYGYTYGIHWGKNKPDRDGFEVARKALKQEAQNVIDTATLSPVEQLLGLLNDFRNWKYVGNDKSTSAKSK